MVYNHEKNICRLSTSIAKLYSVSKQIMILALFNVYSLFSMSPLSPPPPPLHQSNVGKTTTELIQILNNYQHCVWREGEFCSESFKMSIQLSTIFFSMIVAWGKGVFHLPSTTPLSLKLESWTTQIFHRITLGEDE